MERYDTYPHSGRERGKKRRERERKARQNGIKRAAERAERARVTERATKQRYFPELDRLGFEVLLSELTLPLSELTLPAEREHFRKPRTKEEYLERTGSY